MNQEFAQFTRVPSYYIMVVQSYGRLDTVERIRGTHYLSKAGFEVGEIRALILRRRLQVLVHSCIYYHFNDSLISDAKWQRWANELVQLQREYPHIARRVDYHAEFKNFDATTGFDLPITNPEIERKAQQLIYVSRSKKKKK